MSVPSSAGASAPAPATRDVPAAFLASAQRAGRDASAWTVADLERDTRWVTPLDDDDRAALVAGVRAGRVPDKPLLQYRAGDFPFGARVVARLRAAVHEAELALQEAEDRLRGGANELDQRFVRELGHNAGRAV